MQIRNPLISGACRSITAFYNRHYCMITPSLIWKLLNYDIVWFYTGLSNYENECTLTLRLLIKVCVIFVNIQLCSIKCLCKKLIFWFSLVGDDSFFILFVKLYRIVLMNVFNVNLMELLISSYYFVLSNVIYVKRLQCLLIYEGK